MNLKPGGFTVSVRLKFEDLRPFPAVISFKSQTLRVGQVQFSSMSIQCHSLTFLSKCVQLLNRNVSIKYKKKLLTASSKQRFFQPVHWGGRKFISGRLQLCGSLMRVLISQQKSQSSVSYNGCLWYHNCSCILYIGISSMLFVRYVFDTQICDSYCFDSSTKKVAETLKQLL